MEQGYVEVLVERERNKTAGAGKIICGILAAVCIAAMAVSVFAFLPAAAFAAASYYCCLMEWIEYEYTYISRELTIDTIMMRSRRKRAAAYLLDKIEIGAPEKSFHLDSYRNRKTDTKDFSSRMGKPSFVFYYEGNQKVILDADEKLIAMLRSAAPSKIFQD